MSETKKKTKRTFVKLMSPVGKVIYCHLNKPDYKFKTEGEYKTTLLIPEGPEADAFEQAIIAAGKQAAEKDGTKLKKNFSLPIKRWEDLDEEKQEKNPELKGFVQFTFKASKKPLQVDSKRNPLPANIFVSSGDVARLSLSATAWASPLGSGIKVYLNGVQLIEKNSFGGSSANDFDDYEGGFVAEADPEADGEEDEEL